MRRDADVGAETFGDLVEEMADGHMDVAGGETRDEDLVEHGADGLIVGLPDQRGREAGGDEAALVHEPQFAERRRLVGVPGGFDGFVTPDHDPALFVATPEDMWIGTSGWEGALIHAMRVTDPERRTVPPRSGYQDRGWVEGSQQFSCRGRWTRTGRPGRRGPGSGSMGSGGDR